MMQVIFEITTEFFAREADALSCVRGLGRDSHLQRGVAFGSLELSHAERRAENKEHRALRGVREVVNAADGSEVRVGESGGSVGERRRGAGRQKEE